MSKKIPLSQGQFAIVDDEDYQELSQFKWHAYWDKTTKSFYARRSKPNSRSSVIIMHRVIMNNPNGLQVDHIHHDTLDNRKCNLRTCTASQNMMNRGLFKNNKSGYTGVYLCKKSNKWRAQININKKQTYLGMFSNKHEAARVYNRYCKKHHGEFGVKNIIKE